MTNALKQALATLAAATAAVACGAHPSTAMGVPSQRTSLAGDATSFATTCRPVVTDALAEAAPAGEEDGSAMAPCSEDAVDEAVMRIRAQCGNGPGWALLWCSDDGGLERTRIRCNDDPPDLVLGGGDMIGVLARNGGPATAILIVALAGHPVAAQDAGYVGLDWRPGVQVASQDGTKPLRTRDYPVVTTVYECSPAEYAGFRVGDIVEAVDGQDGRILPLFNDSSPGVTHVVAVRRGGERLDLTVTETERLRENEEPSDRCETTRRKQEAPPVEATRRTEEAPPVAGVYLPGRPDRGYLGLAWEPGTVISYDDKPIRTYEYAVITNVYKCSPAEKAGFRVGDLLVVVDGRDGKILPLFNDRRPGATHVATVRRGDEELELTVTEITLRDAELARQRCGARAPNGKFAPPR